jgi:hypothetical protein
MIRAVFLPAELGSILPTLGKFGCPSQTSPTGLRARVL